MENRIETLSSEEIELTSGGVDIIPISFDLAAMPSANGVNTSFPTQTLYGVGVQDGNVTFGVGRSSDTVGVTIKIDF